MSLAFETARPGDDDAIFALNYRTFVEEIPQHPPNPTRRLVDRFHDQNTYIVARDGERVVGMVALRADRPFSLDEKIGPVDRFLPEHRSLCEVRLLAVEPQHRSGRTFAQLLHALVREGLARGHDLAVVSGTTRQTRLYRHLGCVPFGEPVGPEDARYQPMYLTLDAFEARGARALRRGRRRGELTSFLPGPVAIHPAIASAFARPAVSHRSEAFVESVRGVEAQLATMVGARHCTLMLGSGTLANDAVAAQLALREEPGAVVVDGEFGRRLADHAHRAGLAFGTFARPWGEPWTMTELDDALEHMPGARWLWLTLCETSTGVQRDLDGLRDLAARRDLRLCLDAVSAIGAVDLNLTGVSLATAVSGKALGSYPGLAAVLHDEVPDAAPDQIPCYLDLGHYRACGGVPFTQSSNLVEALATALARQRAISGRERPAMAAWLRGRLRSIGLRPVIADDRASPAVTTFRAPVGVTSRELGDRLRAAGFLVSYESAYLLDRGWLQICLMGDCRWSSLRSLVHALGAALESSLAAENPR